MICSLFADLKWSLLIPSPSSFSYIPDTVSFHLPLQWILSFFWLNCEGRSSVSLFSLLFLSHSSSLSVFFTLVQRILMRRGKVFVSRIVYLYSHSSSSLSGVGTSSTLHSSYSKLFHSDLQPSLFLIHFSLVIRSSVWSTLLFLPSQFIYQLPSFIEWRIKLARSVWLY